VRKPVRRDDGRMNKTSAVAPDTAESALRRVADLAMRCQIVPRGGRVQDRNDAGAKLLDYRRGRAFGQENGEPVGGCKVGQSLLMSSRQGRQTW
jgi:hypothetical protein